MLKRLRLERFTVFGNVDLHFSQGLNVFIGANATGKTHLMKLAYSILEPCKRTYQAVADPHRSATSQLEDRIASKLSGVFCPEGNRIARLVRRTIGNDQLKTDQGIASQASLSVEAGQTAVATASSADLKANQALWAAFRAKNPTADRAVHVTRNPDGTHLAMVYQADDSLLGFHIFRVATLDDPIPDSALVVPAPASQDAIISKIELEYSEGLLNLELTSLGKLLIRNEIEIRVPGCTFVPAREVLSLYPGFIKAYRDRELSFDGTYYDLCVALTGLPLHGPRGEEASELSKPLVDYLNVNVTLSGDQFYLASDDGIIEAPLAAEGYRKIAVLMHLIANGSLMKNSILFWDEPEANLNPRLIKVVADFLLRLAAAGVQIFIATHDYLLTTELSLQAEYQTEASKSAPIRFFVFHRTPEKGVEVQSGATLAELEENPIMEEFAALYERERRLFQENNPVGPPRVQK